MAILDDAESHFKKVRAESQIEIDVPEWKAKLVVRRGSAAQKEKFFYFYRQGEYLKAQAWMLIKRCYLEDGSRAFPHEQSAEKRLLESVDPNIIIRIAGQISDFDATENIDPEEALKN